MGRTDKGWGLLLVQDCSLSSVTLSSLDLGDGGLKKPVLGHVLKQMHKIP